MNKKVGVLTHYYNSKNYGGLLQSYALERYINNQTDLNTEQVCLEMHLVKFGEIKKAQRRNLFRFLNPNKYYNRIKYHIIKFYNKLLQKSFLERNNIIKKFENTIKHSVQFYNANNIKRCNDDYDIFITGSDQVWNLNWFDPNYFLEFVPKGKKKISYAVSIGQSNLAEDRKEYFRRILPTFDAVSVREKDAVDLLQPLTDKKIEWVLDPTLLLDRKDWDEICPERRIKEKYLFCYFLGHDKRVRTLAKQYAKIHHLKIVNLPHLCGISKSDIGFGNYKLYDVAPNDFISLIKYAECIFTDSFHACVFSGIYNKNFIAFNRCGMENMATRIYSLCELFECQDHFCDTDDKFNMEYIEKLQPVNYNKDFTLLNEMKKKSIMFLLENLKD